MVTHFILEVVLMVLALLVAVPSLTGGAVAVRHGGFFRGLLVLLVVALLNVCLWVGLTLATLGLVWLAHAITLGLVGLIAGVLVNGLAFYWTSKLLPDVLYVRSFWSAVGAGIVMSLASCLVHMLL